MKRWKKIIRNCPYLIVLLLMWLFMTVGGIGLMIYRGYAQPELKEFWANPLFAIIMEKEMHGDGAVPDNIQQVMAQDEKKEESLPQQVDKIPLVIQNVPENHIDILPEDMTDKAQEKDEESIIGKTLFTTYEPVETDSIYYSDAGKVALTTEYPYATVEDGYFDDAVFFGDSRTLGISDYAGLSADFFCENGMTIYKLLDEKGVVNQGTGEKTDLNQVLQQKEYGKIYIMLGMNELGYRDTPYFLEQYGLVLEQLRQWQPHAVIYIQANLHVSRQKNNPDTEFNNININDKNAAIATLANGTDVFYLDINPLFTDNESYLKDDLTFDGVHLFADGYTTWKTFLMEHAVVRATDGNEDDAVTDTENIID